MTPRNLVPSTPMRFISAEDHEKKPKATVKGKKAIAVPLPPGYVDRAAQRRQGLDSAVNFEDLPVVLKVPAENETKEKLEFLEEQEGSSEFPTCSNELTERLMNFILSRTSISKQQSSNESFRPNEAFLQFKSIEEAKTQPFDPFNRPKKVFRATRSKVISSGFDDEELVLERVKEAMGRLRTSTERNQKYLEALALASASTSTEAETEIYMDIFPEAGLFDERAALESVVNNQKDQTGSKSKAKDRLFGSASSKKQPQQKEPEIDVFDLIAQKSLGATETVKKEEDTSGGLFGFTEFLPKLSRLDSNDTKTKLSGAYASILSDGEDEPEDSSMTKREKTTEEDNEDDYLYPGYLENDPIAFDSDAEDEDEPSKPANGKGQKRRMARKEDKEAAKVEKLVKSKFGVDLTK